MFRILIPFITGILLQSYFHFSIITSLLTLSLSGLLLVSFFFLRNYQRFSLTLLNGITTCLLFIFLGAFLSYTNDARNKAQWFGKTYTDSSLVLVTLEEPPVEKTNSLKAEVSVTNLFTATDTIAVTGKLVIYFSKDSLASSLQYGSQLIFKKNIQEIRNNGNPGAFDYKQYALWHGITHQVYLQSSGYILLPETNKNAWTHFIYRLQERVLSSLRRYIKPGKELGLAEALLIGYKNDLDKTLVQSYSNTGVVHIIAISGLHLGLIYWLLLKLFQLLQKRKKLKWLRPFLIIAGLWIFTCLAGAQPSVLRSALMFTCLAAGESLTRKTSMYNTLSLSAFLLLCYDPYWLWDAGFQLSYAAVISIVIFGKPVYNLFYFKNKMLDQLWKLNAVTMAAQILTIPVCLYYFHQFPTYFLFTNLIAVPLSSFILMAEIFLCCIAFIPFIATWTGKITGWLIWIMNTYIERIEQLPFSLWNGLQVNIVQAVLLAFFLAGAAWWLTTRSRLLFKSALWALLGFITLRSWSFIKTKNQEKIIVYNIPQKKAVDIISGNRFCFIGDSSLQTNIPARNFYLTPSRILNRTSNNNILPGLSVTGNYISFHDFHLLWLDQPLSFIKANQPQTIDLLLLSKNARSPVKEMVSSLKIGQVVLDATVPAWQASRLQKECDSLHIPCHDVTLKGAFAINLR